MQGRNKTIFCKEGTSRNGRIKESRGCYDQIERKLGQQGTGHFRNGLREKGNRTDASFYNGSVFYFLG